jgi:hypothetical protein
MRPKFDEIRSYDEFAKYYWYREELSKICKVLGMEHTGTKQQMNRNIEEYFNGDVPEKRNKTANIRKQSGEITLDSKLLECGFSFSAGFRDYFSKQTGIENYHFNADMVATWRKVKEDNDTTFTIQDMLDVHYKRSNYARYDKSSCQWNQFLKDFCADENNTVFRNKLKVASILWKIVRESTDEKIYTKELREANFESIKEYCR